ncbi:hypothetical protein J6590_016221 [Homalodisca vitripennis]|nr:hypothetical protein J6590_016221 [Homalodisca vitripennis]
MKELLNANQSKKKSRAPGLDYVTYSMISHLPKNALEILLTIYNKIWNNEEHIPIPVERIQNNRHIETH